MRRFVLPALLLFACADDSDAALECDPAIDRAGTYLYSAVERPGGTCGPMMPELVTLSSFVELPDNCELTAPDMLAENDCRLRRQITCYFEDELGPFAVDLDATTWQRDEAGDLVEGVLGTVAWDAAGTFCSSIYDIAYDRQ